MENLAQLTLKVIFYEILTFIQSHLHVHVTDMVNNMYHRTLTVTLHNTLLILKTVTDMRLYPVTYNKEHYEHSIWYRHLNHLLKVTRVAHMSDQ